MNNMSDKDCRGVVFVIEIQGTDHRTFVGKRPSCVDGDAESIKVLGIRHTVAQNENERDSTV